MRPVLSQLLLASLATSHFVPAPKDLITKKGYAGINVRYKEVPTGICELDPSVKSYSGYADVGENQHLFFWFFEARTVNASEAPLTVWINGGPGSSSMIGLFQELGPCRIDKDYKVHNNPYSWTEASNVMFVDQPVTVGMSYSEPVNAYQDPSSSTGDVITLPGDKCPGYAAAYGTCGTYSYSNQTLTANSTAAAAPNMWKLVQGFMGAFPQYSRNGFHFTTESYGGHYGPVFNEYFETQNAKNIKGAHKISLESVSIGNGWYYPLIQYQAYYNYTVSPGNPYDFKPFNHSIQEQMYNALYGKGNCVDQIKYCEASGIDGYCSTADSFCANQVEEVLDIFAKRDEYDIRELLPDPLPPSFYVDYLNTPKVQAAIGAYQNYSDFSYTVGNAFGATGDDARERGTIESVGKLLKQGVTVTMYAGSSDYNCNFLGGEVVAGLVDAPGFSTAGYANLTTADGMVYGQVKQAGKFAFAVINFSGHEVPFYQPVAALALFRRAITGKDIATGKITPSASYKTKGPATDSYREGISTVQMHVLPDCATYNITTHEPNKCGAKGGSGGNDDGRRSVLLKRSRLLSRGRKVRSGN